MQHAKRRPALVTIAVALAVLVGAVLHPALGAESSQLTLERELEIFIDDLFESEPSWGGALVARDGRILLEKSYGWADHSQAKPNTRKTVFRIQSLSKTFTASATSWSGTPAEDPDSAAS